jgi:hypothetical protein
MQGDNRKVVGLFQNKMRWKGKGIEKKGNVYYNSNGIPPTFYSI